MHRLIARTAACAVTVLWFTLPAASASHDGLVVAARNVLQTAVDLDKTVAFYRALGLDIGDLGADGSIFPGKRVVQRPGPSSDLLIKLTAVRDSKFRGMSARIPAAGFDLELVEFAGVPLKDARPRIQDPNATTLVLTVRDVDAALAAAKKGGGTVITAGGKPVSIGAGKSRSVFVKDPDGYYVELTQLDQPDTSVAGILNTKASSTGNIMAGRFARTIQDTDKTLRFYREALGFETQPGAPFAGNPMLADLMGVPAKTQFRISLAKVPNSSVQWELIEFKDADSKPFHLRLQDPGMSGFSMYVSNVDEAVRAIKAGGGAIVTLGGGAVQLANSRNVITTDPEGSIVDMTQTAGQ
jgi:predicted enzyme related to lactoylglutathione lyase